MYHQSFSFNEPDTNFKYYENSSIHISLIGSGKHIPIFMHTSLF